MLISYRGQPVDDFLEVIALSDHEWRVCDARIDPSEASRLLAFIEAEGGSYSVLRLGTGQRTDAPPGGRENYDCLAAALAALSASETERSATERDRPPAGTVPTV